MTNTLEITDDKGIANCFHENFTSIASKLVEVIGDEPEVKVNYSATESMFVYNATLIEVVKVIELLQPKQSSGKDENSNQVIKSISLVIATYLTYLINPSFKTGCFPERLKWAKVLPLFQQGSKTDLNKYRPISLFICLGKIYERIMHKRLYNFLDICKVFYSNQFGFRKT